MKPFGLHRQDRDALLGAHLFADALQVVADEPHDAGGVDERGLGVVPVDEFDQGLVELLFPAEDHVHFLKVGGKAQAVQLRPRRQRPPDVPGVGGAADGAVHQVQGVGDGVEHHPGAAEDAGPLAHRPGQALPVAIHLEGRFALAVDLVLAFFKNGVLHDLSSGDPTGRPSIRKLGDGVWSRRPLPSSPDRLNPPDSPWPGRLFQASRMASMASSPSTSWYQ